MYFENVMVGAGNESAFSLGNGKRGRGGNATPLYL